MEIDPPLCPNQSVSERCIHQSDWTSITKYFWGLYCEELIYQDEVRFAMQHKAGYPGIMLETNKMKILNWMDSIYSWLSVGDWEVSSEDWNSNHTVSCILYVNYWNANQHGYDGKVFDLDSSSSVGPGGVMVKSIICVASMPAFFWQMVGIFCILLQMAKLTSVLHMEAHCFHQNKKETLSFNYDSCISWLQDPYHVIVSYCKFLQYLNQVKGGAHRLLGKCKQLFLGSEWGWIINRE